MKTKEKTFCDLTFLFLPEAAAAAGLPLLPSDDEWDGQVAQSRDLRGENCSSCV